MDIISIGWTLIYLCLKKMNETVGVIGIFTIFGAAAFLEGVFIYVALPETKDRTLQEIEDYFQVGLLIITLYLLCLFLFIVAR